MPDLAPTYSKRQHLSVSTLMDFVRCPRRFFYKKSGLQSRDPAPALLYGTAMHKAIPVCLTQGLESAVETFNSVWLDNEFGDTKRNAKRAKAQLSHFYHTHSGGRSIYSFEVPPKGDITPKEDVSPFEVESYIDVGLSVPLLVRVDGLVRHRDTGELWGFEFKTVSGWTYAKIFEGLEMHPQVLTYTLALRTLTGERIRGMMTEAMLIDASKVDNMTHPIPVQEHQLDGAMRWLQFYGELLLACEAKVDELGAEAFVQNWAGCTPYAHHYMSGFACDYANLCRVDDWKKLVSFYDVVPEAEKEVRLTVKGV